MNIRGLSLLEIVAALVIIAIGLVAMGLKSGISSKQVTGLDAVGDTVDIGRFLRTLTDCGNTFDAATRTACLGKNSQSNEYIDVRAADGAVLTKSDSSTVFGSLISHTVRSKCVDQNGFFGVEFEVRSQLPGQVTSTWKPLFSGVPFACP